MICEAMRDAAEVRAYAPEDHRKKVDLGDQGVGAKPVGTPREIATHFRGPHLARALRSVPTDRI